MQGNVAPSRPGRNTGVRLWLCDPHSRGQRQHLREPNGLLRQYLPKDTELATYTHDEPDAITIANTINSPSPIASTTGHARRPTGRWLADSWHVFAQTLASSHRPSTWLKIKPSPNLAHLVSRLP